MMYLHSTLKVTSAAELKQLSNSLILQLRKLRDKEKKKLLSNALESEVLTSRKPVQLSV